MNEHIDDLMDAYLDEELSAARARRVEAHLSDCLDCRQRLERRHSLRLVLGEALPAAGLKPEARFVAEVELRLERRGPALAPKARALNLGWTLFPVGLFLAAVFVQVVLIINTMVDIIPGAGQALTAPAGLLTGVPALTGGVGGMLGLVEWIGLPDLGWISLLGILAMIAVLYVGWLASWWSRTRQAAGNSNEVV